MEQILNLLKIVFPSISPVIILACLLLFFPEKIEKWSAILWKILSKIGFIFKGAHKKYVKHDLQGRINDFVRRLGKEMPDLANEKIEVQWIDPKSSRSSFLSNGKIVLRLRRDDSEYQNIVHGSYLFVSKALLKHSKRYLSPSQKEAVDLFVCSRIIKEEKPAIVGIFLDEYLHPKTKDKRSKIAKYVDAFSIIDSGKFFFPILIQELEFLGNKVFGKRRDDLIIKDVNRLIEFLKPIAVRQVGQEMDLNFEGEYCRFGLVIIGKPLKLQQSIEPYVGYIKKVLVERDIETIYLLSKNENSSKVEKIYMRFSDLYECCRKMNFSKVLRYRWGNREADLYLMILRKKGIDIIQPSK